MIRAVAVGDSITRTGGAIVSDDIEPLSWSQRIARAGGWQLDTFAVSGAPTSEIIGLVPSGTYDVALTCVGTNDVLSPRQWDESAFRNELAELLHRLAAIADKTVVLGLVPNVGKLPIPFAYGWGLGRRVASANQIIEEESLRTGATVVFPAALTRPVDHFGDCVHPTSFGHITLANEVLPLLGLPLIVNDGKPSPKFLAWTRRRLISDSLKRPMKGLGSSILAAIRL